MLYCPGPIMKTGSLRVATIPHGRASTIRGDVTSIAAKGEREYRYMEQNISTTRKGNVMDRQATSGPHGIGVAVAFDWAFALQMVVMPIVQTILGSMGVIKQPQIQVGTVIGPLVIAVIFAALGEGLRSGRGWARIIQLVISSLGFLGGIGGLFLAIPALGRGNYLLLVPVLVLLIISPIIVWRLSRPVTGRWFKTVSIADARRRHGGAWPWLILIWSLVGGVVVALSASLMQR